MEKIKRIGPNPLKAKSKKQEIKIENMLTTPVE